MILFIFHSILRSVGHRAGTQLSCGADGDAKLPYHVCLLVLGTQISALWIWIISVNPHMVQGARDYKIHFSDKKTEGQKS